ncbi:uncharacterized protein K460DRAFT_361251 [Cucurbitaria berberidis CBS 394.84]|uniref:Extracellular membrane protein CFEM domain-containing protein n=1 Tax=Cucurbitaria berberidis CBS 394.84 TaxID=1168544 RepID=A0A9P4GS60_9PLEO|nr:uncharacterized protein K460DRAFT_361251 [Cucurbitaria berberidis CBS 394.84]KAF1850471.1 hypothetical protein K460DRAFT_361251 [Cucurbitaria berberidis CBS 394.84]
MRCTFVITSLFAAAAAVPDPLITPRAALAPRQARDPALLGWVDAPNGQFSDQRSCDFPATLSSSGALAQCCATSSCTFWQSCSAGTLFAQQASLFCDQGYCNTAVLVPTVGASSGLQYLGCWATSLGEQAFTVVRDIGSGPVATSAPSSGSASASAGSSAASSRATSARSSDAGSASSHSSASATQSSASAASSTAAAAVNTAMPLTGVFGLVALLFGVL